MWAEAIRRNSSFATAIANSQLSTVLLTIVFILSLKIFLPWLRKYRILKRVPGPSDVIPPMFLLATYGAKFLKTKPGDVTHEVHKFVCDLISRFTRPNEGIVKLYLGFSPLVILSSAQTVEVILTDNVNLRKPITYHFMDKWIGGSLLTSDGDLWRFQRKLLTPSFHFKILDDFMVVFNKHASNFVTFLNELPAKNDVRLFREMSKCTLNVIGETTLGYDLDAMSGENSYGKSLALLQFLVVARTIRPWMWLDSLYYRFTMEGSLADGCIKAMHGLSTRILVQRKQQALEAKAADDQKNLTAQPQQDMKKKKLKSLLELLLDNHIQDPTRVSEDLVRTEVDMMLFAGQDTTATSTAWTMFLLGHHLDIQENCRKEIFRILGPNPKQSVDSEQLKLMKYTDACVKESMRLYPPIPLMGRKLDTDIQIKGTDKEPYTIPAGVQVFTSIYHLHRDPNFFPDPEKFMPERFLDDNAPHKSHPFAYIPFSGGPRNCIGQKFATMEIKVILAFLLRNFKWTSNRSREDTKVCFEIVTRARGDLRIDLHPLNLSGDQAAPKLDESHH